MVHTRALIHEMMFVVRNRISAHIDINDVEVTLSAAGAQRKNIPNVQPHDLTIVTDEGLMPSWYYSRRYILYTQKVDRRKVTDHKKLKLEL